MSKLGGAGDKFGDYLCEGCANFPLCKWTQSKLTKHITKCRSLSMKHAREGAEFADVALQNERDE